MVGRIAERVEHHHAVGDGGVDAAQPVIAVQPLGHEGDGLADGAVAAAARKQWLSDAQDGIDALEEPPPARAVRPADPVPHMLWRGAEQLAHLHATRIARDRPQRHQHQQWDDHRARPVRHLGQMERKPQRQVHDLQRHHRHGAPRHLAEQRELGAGEDVAAFRPAGVQDGATGARHVRRVRVVADRLQRVIRLDAGRQVEGAVMEQWPAAMLTLDRAQIDADLRLQGRVDAGQKMLQQHVFGRDGGVGLQLEQPVAVGVLAPRQGIAGAAHRVGQGIVGRRLGDERIGHAGSGRRLCCGRRVGRT